MKTEYQAAGWVVAVAVGLGLHACGTTAETIDDDVVVIIDQGTDGIDDPGPVWDGKVRTPPDWVTSAGLRPHSIHVTWVGDTGQSATVQWQTADSNPADYTPMVWFAREDEVQTGEGDDVGMPFDSSHVAEGAGFTYLTFTDKNPQLDVVHWAVDVHGLVPDTKYFYRAGTWGDFDDQVGEFVGPNLTPVHSFKTGASKGIRTPFRFVLAGDSRSDQGKLAENGPRFGSIEADFWLFSGDMTEAGTQTEWWSWFDALKPVLTRCVFMPVQGNHEFLADHYYNQWSLPGMAGLPQEYREHGWSFDYGNLHVVGLDSYHLHSMEGQRPWLESDLSAAAADPDIDWIVVMFHHAAYSASNHGSTKSVQELWVPLLEEHGVDLVLNGHDHNYERTHPIRGDQVVGPGEGVVYVVAGAFYAPSYGNGNEWWTAVSEHGDKGNYAIIEVNDKVLSVTAYSVDGQEILDEFVLSKEM